MKKNRPKRKIKLKIYFFLILISAAIIFLFFKDLGVITYFELIEKNKKIEVEILEYKKKNKLLDDEIGMLEIANSETIELEARKRQIFKKDNERVYRLKEIKTFKSIK